MMCSGRVIRSQYLVTGLKASLVVTARLSLCSSCCRTGSGCLEAKVSAGNTSSGILLTVAVAQAVTMLAAPGPTDDAQAMIFFLLFCFANAVATWHIPCSFLPCITLSRSEEHTSELQSRFDLVCRLLLDKKNYF